MAGRQIAVTMDEERISELEHFAAAHSLSVSTVMRLAITKFLADPTLDLAKSERNNAA